MKPPALRDRLRRSTAAPPSAAKGIVWAVIFVVPFWTLAIGGAVLVLL
jgi:hypothetical protein